LLNRLAEANVDPISKEIHGLRREFASADVTNVLSKSILEQMAAGPKIGEQLLVVYAAVIAAQHIYSGAAAGSVVLEAVVGRMREAFSIPETEEAAMKESFSPPSPKDQGSAAEHTMAGEGSDDSEDDEAEDKGSPVTNEQHNLARLLGFMYIMGMMHAALIIDILRLFACRLYAADVRIILNLLRSIGSRLRVDDGMAVRNLLKLVRERAEELGYVIGQGRVAGAAAAAAASDGERARVQVLLEVLGGLRRAKQKQE